MKNRLKDFFSKQTLSYIIVGVLLVVIFVVLQNFSSVTAVFSSIFKLLSPFMGGIVLAYVLNLLLRPIETKLLRKVKRKGVRRTLGILITFLCALAILAAVIWAIIPQLVRSIIQLFTNLAGNIDSSSSIITNIANLFNISDSFVEWMFGTWDNLVEWASKISKEVLSTVGGAAVQVGYGIFNSLISLVTAIYLLADKERLILNVKRTFRALLRDKPYFKLTDIARRAQTIFSQYIGKTLLDSLIVATICCILMLLFNIPYALLISVFIGLANFIPKFGGFIGAIPSALLILFISPIKSLIFLLIIIAIQILDSNVIVPKLLGGNTGGLSGFWVLVAIWICGSIWGIGGLLFGVPLFAILYFMIGDAIRDRLRKRGYTTDGEKIKGEDSDLNESDASTSIESNDDKSDEI